MMTIEAIAAALDVNGRWIPGVEHGEKILDEVRAGNCHIEHRGHRTPPLLVFNDGGAMELPSVRWMETARGMRLASVSDTHGEHSTTHYDVCGTVDTIERILADHRDRAAILPLLDDIEAMIRRMASRRAEYERFVEEVRRALEAPVRRKEVEPAYAQLAGLRSMVAAAEGATGSDAAADGGIVELAEQVRDIAQYLEYALTDHREIAVGINRLYRNLRGRRNWDAIESR
jgi:hypothetical protein